MWLRACTATNSVIRSQNVKMSSSSSHANKRAAHESKAEAKYDAAVKAASDSHPTRDHAAARERAGHGTDSASLMHKDSDKSEGKHDHNDDKHRHGHVTHIVGDHTGPHAGSESAHKGASTGHSHTKGSR